MKTFAFPDRLPNHVIQVSYFSRAGVLKIEFVSANDSNTSIAPPEGIRVVVDGMECTPRVDGYVMGINTAGAVYHQGVQILDLKSDVIVTKVEQHGIQFTYYL